jgi:hypothetical protein
VRKGDSCSHRVGFNQLIAALRTVTIGCGVLGFNARRFRRRTLQNLASQRIYPAKESFGAADVAHDLGF